ncbi:linear amide C-N hydrolase [Vibrio ishigakensis]|nr:linear amide C-N hydrolase [Vibrio ishigakensis]
MKKKLIISCLAAALTTTALIPTSVSACTRMLWNTDSEFVIVGRNEDYFSASAPTLVKTPRGIERRGSVDDNANAIEWRTKYGSIAAFANNRFPMDGMNEKGLTARTLYFDQGEIDQVSTSDDMPELDGDHWVSYVLDNFATVDEAVKALESVKLVAIKGGYSYSASPKHLSIADSTGDSAIVEIQDGEVKIFHGKQYQVMTNPPNMQTQISKAKERSIDVNDGTFPNTWGAEDRFQKAQYWLDTFPKVKGTDDINAAYGFMYSALGTNAFVPGMALPSEDKAVGEAIMKHTSPEDSYGVGTYFQSISDLTNLVYRFKSVLAPQDVYIELGNIDWNKEKAVSVIPRIDRHAQNGLEGNIAGDFQPISEQDIYQQAVVQ